MARYIDIEPLEKEGWYMARVYNDSLTSMTYETKKLKDFPIADVVERKRGEWILTEDDNYEYCTCSECGYQNGENWMNGSDIPFCAECGADMRKEVKE